MTKPLQINPIKLSQPMGAMLFFLGVKNSMPLMHGAQGCASFSKVFFTRHFSDPIAVQTTAVNDITAVIDGGDYSISEAIKNITKKVKPDLVGLFTTGMTETKGDDIKGATYLLKDKQKMVYVHTPDFEGGLESGFAKAIEATIEQLVEPTTVIDKQKALIIPHVSLTPIEIEILKEELEGFGFTPYALPDLSESLDGHLGLKQGAVSSGGIEVSDIEALGESAVVLTIGDSVKKCGLKMLEKNKNTTHLHFNTIAGLKKGDAFYKALLDFSALNRPTSSVIRWRKRLQDALLDTHFAIGGAKVVIACEP
ncbi:MAG TPA: nitrogenase iron-molybdenum cofactor biosynthesis protein NifN, partial [Campylobacterales bacterium]|nr:nitrogenase iron-molybdenum cofactor biosynthesis protein NifN [Campylobacterales bacterium]